MPFTANVLSPAGVVRMYVRTSRGPVAYVKVRLVLVGWPLHPVPFREPVARMQVRPHPPSSSMSAIVPCSLPVSV